MKTISKNKANISMTNIEKYNNERLHDAVNIINLFYALGLNWHPDDDFSNYIDDDGQTMSHIASSDLNWRLVELWNICNVLDIDIYELTMIFGGRSYEQVTAYYMDGRPHIGLKDSYEFKTYGIQSEDLGDGMQTVYITL